MAVELAPNMAPEIGVDAAALVACLLLAVLQILLDGLSWLSPACAAASASCRRVGGALAVAVGLRVLFVLLSRGWSTFLVELESAGKEAVRYFHGGDQKDDDDAPLSDGSQRDLFIRLLSGNSPRARSDVAEGPPTPRCRSPRRTAAHKNVDTVDLLEPRAAVRRIKAQPRAYFAVPLTAALGGLVANFAGLGFHCLLRVSLGGEAAAAEGLSILSQSRSNRTDDGGRSGELAADSKATKFVERMRALVLGDPDGKQEASVFAEAFAQLDAGIVAQMMQPQVDRALVNEFGQVWSVPARTGLFYWLKGFVESLKEEVDTVLDLRSALHRGLSNGDRTLSQLLVASTWGHVGYLASTGVSLGFTGGLVGMLFRALVPMDWVLPVTCGLAGFLAQELSLGKGVNTNAGGSDGAASASFYCGSGNCAGPALDVAEILGKKVLRARTLLGELVDGLKKEQFEALVRRSVPPLIDGTLATQAICAALRRLAVAPRRHQLHTYVEAKLALEKKFASRLITSPALLLDALGARGAMVRLSAIGGAIGLLVGLLLEETFWGRRRRCGGRETNRGKTTLCHGSSTACFAGETAFSGVGCAAAGDEPIAVAATIVGTEPVVTPRCTADKVDFGVDAFPGSSMVASTGGTGSPTAAPAFADVVK
eukprot:TRINITY_DN33895_c0_g1_i1.p1 TRINITY_DN33895_c0_g1~~TRINITY_DN33895_c0_g1_i1.p1  ORF type:complete len:653 (+),score=132.41 TRINITY_DN33895_c0_g1_i1:88-2046(+)